MKDSLVTLAPGAGTLTLTWIGAIESGLSITLLTLSIAFLIWRWRKAYKNKIRSYTPKDF
jgi:hypothetical protein